MLLLAFAMAFCERNAWILPCRQRSAEAEGKTTEGGFAAFYCQHSLVRWCSLTSPTSLERYLDARVCTSVEFVDLHFELRNESS